MPSHESCSPHLPQGLAKWIRFSFQNLGSNTRFNQIKRWDTGKKYHKTVFDDPKEWSGSIDIFGHVFVHN